MNENYLIYLFIIIAFVGSFVFLFLRRKKNKEEFNKNNLSINNNENIDYEKLRKDVNEDLNNKWTPEQLRQTKLYKDAYDKWIKLYRSEDYNEEDEDNIYNSNTKNYYIFKLSLNDSKKDAEELQDKIDEAVYELKETMSWYYEGINDLECRIYEIYEKMNIPVSKQLHLKSNDFSNSIDKIITQLQSL